MRLGIVTLLLALVTLAPSALAATPLDCQGVDRQAQRKPVLLVPGTTLDPQTNFAWNYVRDFQQRGFPYCTLTSPGDAMADIQVNGQLVAQAIKTMHRATRRKVQVVGHSQGGMVPRWALKYWPGTRRLVDDLVGMAASNHGAAQADAVCAAPGGCAPAIWQQRPGSAFMAALNAGPETFKGISYTSVYTRYDNVVQPNLDESGSTSLRTGAGKRTNVAVQDICPAAVTDHLTAGTSDPVVHALVIDALTHRGPADPARIDPSVCAEPAHPGVDRATFARDLGAVYAKAGNVLLTYPRVPAEPPLAPYAKP